MTSKVIHEEKLVLAPERCSGLSMKNEEPRGQDSTFVARCAVVSFMMSYMVYRKRKKQDKKLLVHIMFLIKLQTFSLNIAFCCFFTAILQEYILHLLLRIVLYFHEEHNLDTYFFQHLIPD